MTFNTKLAVISAKFVIVVSDRLERRKAKSHKIKMNCIGLPLPIQSWLLVCSRRILWILQLVSTYAKCLEKLAFLTH